MGVSDKRFLRALEHTDDYLWRFMCHPEALKNIMHKSSLWAWRVVKWFF